ncbi:MAG: pyrimidine dimer DNA glycosylase/endonuclease V [Proteobacteria bacterium]|nr:pyrimidine dimer DNA glycosylase/endonuclease V [Pseudomonadota bacterium]
MRVWDIHPGFLNRQSLLGEHREIHAIHTIIIQGKKGYSRHPETLRWQGHLGALRLRHEQVVTEMRVRGFNHFSPLPASGTEIIWPSVFIDAPSRQFELLAEKYAHKEQGRLPLPTSVDELLAGHAQALTNSELRVFETQPATPDTFASVASALVKLLRQSAT